MSLIEKILKFFGFEKVLCAVRIRWKLTRKQSEPQQPTNPATDKPIEHLINDPSTPDLVSLVIPSKEVLKPEIAVKGYNGGGHAKDSPEGQAANCYVTISETVQFYNNLSEKPVPKWAGTSILEVVPRAGTNLNAFYNRKSLQFFYANHTAFGGTVYACDSADIVAHELGHAILDAYRPDTWSAMSLEVASLHEAFADFTAMMHLLIHDEVLDHVLKETKGNLKQPNVVAKLAEHFGSAVYKLAGPDGGRSSDALRSAINEFKYVNPSTLPKKAPINELAAECHSFGRIFLGALYDIMVMIYDDLCSSGMTPLDALKQSRDLITKYVLKSIQNVPLNVKFYESFSKTMLWADVTLNNWKYHNRMQEIFSNRNLISANLMMLSGPKCDNENKIVRIQSHKCLKLGDVLLRSQSNNPLYDVEIEIPQEEVFFYDSNNNLIDMAAVSDEESLNSAQDMITYLHETGSVSDDPKTPFEIRDGKLVRTFIS